MMRLSVGKSPYASISCRYWENKRKNNWLRAIHNQSEVAVLSPLGINVCESLPKAATTHGALQMCKHRLRGPKMALVEGDWRLCQQRLLQSPVQNCQQIVGKFGARTHPLNNEHCAGTLKRRSWCSAFCCLHTRAIPLSFLSIALLAPANERKEADSLRSGLSQEAVIGGRASSSANRPS